MAGPSGLIDLVGRFEQNRDAYLSGAYNETQVRREFIDPFFKLLGWDIANEQGLPEAYKDVVHEDAVRIGGGLKAPDYGFRVGGTRRFFVEAKKPSVNVRENASPAFQLRRYAWSAKLPLSILTDFEEFAVYDCRITPNQVDRPSTARLNFFSYSEYPDRWDEIAALFSRDAVLAGSLDTFAEAATTKRGSATVDAVFLKEIESWRDALAKDLALRNPDLTSRQLNFAVQMTIDRIIFLRMAEDRGIEEYGRLQALLNGRHVYDRLRDLYRQADERYNSGLFHFQQEKDRPEQPDQLTPKLVIGDEPLKNIVKNLYFPDSPYEFSVLPVEVLGQVYEQFLGKTIDLTSGRGVKIEEKPEVRKAGGVYYTPKYIVEYIVEHTVGKLLEGKTPGKTGTASKLRIVDPACGSGSFLIGAYEFLLDWHRDRYLELGPEKHRKEIYQGAGGQWLLTTAEKKRILLNNIYGVDIDPQAVEVTKLSLLLKVLEGESAQTIGTQFAMFHERALPDLGNNIKCGNSLIGPDFYDSQQTSFLEPDEHYRINAFDWADAFPSIFTGRDPGFDSVVGNPPYIRIHNLVDHYPVEVRHIQERYASAAFGKVDIYVAFVERGLEILNREGLLGFIVPNKFMQADYGRGLRNLIADRSALVELIDFGHAQIFENATTYTCLLFLSGSTRDSFKAAFQSTLREPREFLADAKRELHATQNLTQSAWSLAYSAESALMRKIEEVGTKFPEIIDIAITGVKTGANDIFTFDSLETAPSGNVRVYPETLDRPVELEGDLLRNYRKAESLKRYSLLPGHRLLLYPYEERDGKTGLISENAMITCYPKTWQYLNEHRAKLEGRQKGALRGPSWYGLSFASALRMFRQPKLVTATLAPRNSFTLDTSNSFFPQGAGGGCGIVLKPSYSPHYVLGILNSRLLTFYFQKISSRFHGGWYAYEPRYLNRIPIALSGVGDAEIHDKIVSFAERMLDLNAKLQASNLNHEGTILQRQLETTDRLLNELVYQLYGLTEDEIALVEQTA